MKIALKDGTILEIIGTQVDNEDAELFDGISSGTTRRFNELFEPIGKLIEQAESELRQSASAASEIKMSFGITVGGEAGVFGIAKTKAETTINIEVVFNS